MKLSTKCLAAALLLLAGSEHGISANLLGLRLPPAGKGVLRDSLTTAILNTVAVVATG
jgi:hypothetical protein